MKDKLNNFIQGVFSIFVLIAVFGGGIIFLMFLAALIIGGEAGGSIAVLARSTIMPYFIKAATIAVAAGLISFYVTKNHTLSLDEKD